MKKLLSMLLILCCLMNGAVLAEEKEAFAPYEAVIANPGIADRLNIREKPDRDAASLGRFYSGTPVTVLDEVTDGHGDVWAKVQVCYAEWNEAVVQGYALREYLMPKNRNYGAPELFVTADPVDGRVMLLDAPGGSQIAAANGPVFVLGDVGDDWRFVQMKDRFDHGYVRTSQLKNRQVLVPEACLQSDSGVIPVYESKDLKKEIARMYPGAPVRITDWHRDGWVKIENEWVGGYVKEENALVFVQPWNVPYGTKTAYLKEAVSLTQPAAFPLPKGAAVAVEGEINGRCMVHFGSLAAAGYNATERFAGLIDKDKLDVTDLPGQINGAGLLGYGLMQLKQDEEGYAEGSLVYPTPEWVNEGYAEWMDLVQVTAVTDDFVQVRYPGNSGAFVKREDVAAIIFDRDLWIGDDQEKQPGEWTAGSSGLWELTAEEGKSASLTVVYPAGEETWTAQDGSCAVYIPEGARAKLTEGGVLRSMNRRDMPVILDQDQAGAPLESECLFAGSGRFLCGVQLASQYNYFSYKVLPVEGEEECWFALGNLFYGEQDRIDVPAGLTEDEYADSWSLDVFPGDFLELHNCRLYVNYGNG